MRILKYTLLLVVLPFCNIQAQVFTTIVPSVKKVKQFPDLKVGDKVPDLLIPELIHSEKPSAKMSDFKDQLLILDFWSVGCKGCIEALPKMQLLQTEFGNRIKILPVTGEARQMVLDFWKNNYYTKSLSLPSVVDDTTLGGYFKHLSIPHEVWIYKGKVIAITEPEYVDAHNITKVLQGDKISFPVKYDFYTFDGRKERLFKPGSKEVGSNKYYTAISGFREGLVSQSFSGAPGIARDKKGQSVRTWFLNEPVFNVYLGYWGQITKFGSLVKPSLEFDANQIIWEVKDRNKYRYMERNGYREDWLRKYAICFESVHPDQGQTDKEVYASIISDLDSLLGLKVRWEKRKEKVLVLKLTGNLDKIRAKTKVDYVEGIDNHMTKDGSLIKLRDYSLKNLNRLFSQDEGQPYVFDETGAQYTDHVDLDLNIPSWTDISAVREALKPYGIELNEEERLVDKFVFTEINGG